MYEQQINISYGVLAGYLPLVVQLITHLLVVLRDVDSYEVSFVGQRKGKLAAINIAAICRHTTEIHIRVLENN